MSVANRTRAFKSQFLKYYEQHEVRFTIGFFLAGFLFDIITLSDVDDYFSVAQQIVYLTIIGFFLFYDFLARFEKVEIVPSLQKIWNYRQIIVHFVFGSLLSIYSLFYFKSSSLVSSFIFIIIMSLILVANELSQVQRAGLWVKFALWALCLNAFFSMMFPTFLGFIGWIPFILSVITTAAIFYFIYKKLLQRQLANQDLKKIFIYPIAAIQVLFVIFYTIGWIPPVPLSAKYMGIYHDIEKKGSEYKLYHQRPYWKFWQNGDQTFYVRPGDKIYFFTNIYSPARFSDEVLVRWVYKDPIDGWVTWDKIPIKVMGGRREGFRGYTYKTNFKEGEWRVQVETTDEREIGRIYLTVVNDTSTDERILTFDSK